MSKRQPEKTSIARRKLLAGGVVLAGSAALAALPTASASAADDNLPPNVPAWMKEQGAPFLSPPYGQPSPFEKNVIRRPRAPTPTNTAASSMTPWQNLHGIVTPNGLHFERHHAGVPAIDPDQHRLVLHGLVKRPLIFTMDDIVRFPSESHIYFLECSGNSFWTGNTPQSTVQHTHGEMSCCEWTGVRLSTVLDEVGLDPRATWMLAEGADAAGMARSVPIAKALDDALLVYAQNGERLRPEQGYPLRLFLPGYEGNTNIKWLRRLKLGDQPFQTREETAKYTDLMPDGTARRFTFVMEAKSVITFPSGGQLLRERILRNLRPGVVRPRADHARRRFHRRWRELERSSPSATHSRQMPDAISPVLELGWRSSAIAKPHRRRDRVRTADACAARRRTRASFQLPLQRHSNMAGRARRSRDQCRIARERS
jgi:sulfane dehydrogenase subunit SoxC